MHRHHLNYGIHDPIFDRIFQHFAYMSTFQLLIAGNLVISYPQNNINLNHVLEQRETQKKARCTGVCMTRL